MRFFKGHGLGNDYIALDLRDYPGNLSPGAVRLLCDRHRGIGSDGILGRTGSERAAYGLRIFNPDGTEAEKSGNGLRIFAAYLLDLGEVGVEQRFSVETAGGVVEMEVTSRGESAVMVEVEMGIATFRTADVGLAGPDREGAGEWLEMAAGDRVTINTVSLGNPHCVIFMDELSADELRRLGPQISSHPHFQHGTNVQFARVAGPSAMEALVWERGAGETLASGSSACAVAAAAVRRGLISGSPIEVIMEGGTLEVTVREDWGVLLRGPVEGVFRGEITDDHRARLQELG
jgi:diaminopimelate epimerase